MSKPSPAAPAATALRSVPAEPAHRLDAIGRYLSLRDWSFALIDLMEVAGKTRTSPDPVEIADPTLSGASALLRELLQQMDERVEVIRGA